jgi:HK97 family phage portal protein
VSLFRRAGWTAEPVVSPFPGVSLFGGSAATMGAAMSNDAVWASVRLLADAVSMMPAHAYTFRAGQRVPIPDPKILVEPEPYTTFATWVYKLMVSALLRGNVYGVPVSYDGNGYRQQVALADPDQCRWVMRDGSWKIAIAGVEYDRSDILHIPAYPMPGSPEGLSPIKFAARRPLAVSNAAAAFGEGFFNDGANPSALIMTNQPMTGEPLRRMKDALQAQIRGREPIILGGPDIKWQQMSIAPEESQFLETQKFTVTQIARIFGVPPEMIGGEASNSMTYANVTQRAMDFLTYNVQPWLTRIEAALSALLPADRHVRFDTSVLVRLDALTQAQVDEIHLTAGVETINEVRHTLDAAPVSWGDEPYLPGMKTAAAAAAFKVDPTLAADEGDPDADTL